jgi:hypothetical protein
MPKPTADHKRLERLAGIWKGTETMQPSQWEPKGGQAQGITRARVALEGFAVISDYEQTRGGKCTFQGHGVCTWDPDQKQVVMHWFDSMGQGREEFRGTWSGDRLVLQSKSPMGFARLTYDFSKPGSLISGMEMSEDGKSWNKLFDGNYRRED